MDTQLNSTTVSKMYTPSQRTMKDHRTNVYDILKAYTKKMQRTVGERGVSWRGVYVGELRLVTVSM